jgi:hypothetical protein
MKISKKLPLLCLICSKPTQRYWHHGGLFGDYKKTCSDECHKKHKSNIFKKVVKDNIEKISKASSERMKVNNPMWMEGVKEKAIATNKALGTKPRVRGGNGEEMPIPQRVLLTALGEGWYAEHVVPTKEPKVNKKYPTCYKIDIANPKMMLGIEVDGESHNLFIRKEQDKKKTDFLNTLGWTIIRFKNKEVMSNLENVLKQIYATTI